MKHPDTRVMNVLPNEQPLKPRPVSLTRSGVYHCYYCGCEMERHADGRLDRPSSRNHSGECVICNCHYDKSEILAVMLAGCHVMNLLPSSQEAVSRPVSLTRAGVYHCYYCGCEMERHADGRLDRPASRNHIDSCAVCGCGNEDDGASVESSPTADKADDVNQASCELCGCSCQSGEAAGSS